MGESRWMILHLTKSMMSHSLIKAPKAFVTKFQSKIIPCKPARSEPARSERLQQSLLVCGAIHQCPFPTISKLNFVPFWVLPAWWFLCKKYILKKKKRLFGKLVDSGRLFSRQWNGLVCMPFTFATYWMCLFISMSTT